MDQFFILKVEPAIPDGSICADNLDISASKGEGWVAHSYQEHFISGETLVRALRRNEEGLVTP